MNGAWRSAVLLILLALLWPEFARYRGEYRLRSAGADVERVMRGVDQGAASVASAQHARAAAATAATLLPADPRAALIEAVALMLLGQSDAAQSVLSRAIAAGERPELTLNLGRARFQGGDEAGAHRAYLRSAWAAPAAIATLPRAMQDELNAEVARLEIELQAGRLRAPPSLD